MSETGALGAGSSNPELRADKAPEVKIEGGKTRTAKVGQAISLTALVTDDGIPKVRAIPPDRLRQAQEIPPYRPTVNKNLGLHLSWFVYRGAGHAVNFEPASDQRRGKTRVPAPTLRGRPSASPPPVPADGKYALQ